MRIATALLAVGGLGLLWSTTSPADTGVPPPSDQAIPAQAGNLWQDPQSPALGNPHGDVTIVEFFDYACPYCKALEPRLEYAVSSDSHVRLILKEFPILTPESLVASRAALAAAKQHKYRQFHDALMGYRGTWQEQVIYDTARSVGLDMPRLRRDMASPAVTNEIIANFNLARSLRIFQTPGFIAGNHILTGPSAQIDFPAVIAAVRGQHR
jgi:protein-disulfide isomerase